MRSWEEFLEQLELELGKHTINRWVRSLKIEKFDSCNLYLQAEEPFQVAWFEEYIRPKIKHFRNNNNRPIAVHIASKKTSNQKSSPQAEEEWKIVSDPIDPRYTFDQYYGTEKNKVVLKFLKERSHLSEFNPIFLHGVHGAGKSHLLMSCAHSLKNAGMQIFYVRAETFTHHVVKAIRSGKMQEFRKAYRNIDALFIDDIHIFSRKSSTQEEFFHTFNTLHTLDKPIFITSHTAPSQLRHIEPRLISRFEWGIVLSLEKPTVNELSIIFEKRLNSLSISLKSTVKEFLIETFANRPENLFLALDALILRAHIDQINDLSIESVKILLRDFIEKEKEKVVTFERILRIVADHYGVTSEDILGKAQSRDCALPRQIAMYFSRSLLRLPYMKIGELFQRDHSTVMTSVRQIQKAVEKKDSSAASIRVITKQLEE